MSHLQRIQNAFINAPVLPLNHNTGYCIFSDCHRGDGSSNDNFLNNENLYFTALKYYNSRYFTYIELGDGDELWENRSPSQIVEIHSNVFSLLHEFYCHNRLFMIFGNHDMEKKSSFYSKRFCNTYYCTDEQCHKRLFPDLVYHEGIKLENRDLNICLYLTHGHQADFWNSTGWKLNRFLVRYLWRPLEHFGVLDPTSAAKNYRHKGKIEKRLSQFAHTVGSPLITGHTHRPRLITNDPLYMNTGSCIHPRCVTCIEADGLTLALVKWTYNTRKDRTLYISREVLSSIDLSHSNLFPGLDEGKIYFS